MKNYYDILKVKSTASADEIKVAYRVFAKKYHPDLNKAVGAKEALVEVNEAYDILGDENKKAEYDKKFADFQNRQKFGYSNKAGTNPYPKTGPNPYSKTAGQTQPQQFNKTFQPPPQYGQAHSFNSQSPPGQQPPLRSAGGSEATLQKHLRDMEVKRAFSDGFNKGSLEAQEKAKITIDQLQQENKLFAERNAELHRKNLQYFSQIEKLNLEISIERAELKEQIQQIEKIAEEDVSHGGNYVKNCPNEVEVENLKIEQTILTARVDRYKETVKQLEEDKAKKEEEIKELHFQLETLNSHIDELDDYIDTLTGEEDEEHFENEKQSK